MSAAGVCLKQVAAEVPLQGGHSIAECRNVSPAGCCNTSEMGAAHLDIVYNDQGPTHTTNGAVVCTGSTGSAPVVLSHAAWHGTELQSSETQ